MSEKRRSDRIDAAIPIEVMGMELSTGQIFHKKTETRVVSRHGAAIVLNAALPIDDEITVRCLANDEEARCRVVGVIRHSGQERIYGIAFLDEGVNPWGIEFPPIAESDKGLARLLLGCGICQNHEVVHLNEIEMQVFEANGSLQRACARCAMITSWQLASPGKPGLSEKKGSAEKIAEPSAHPETNKRKHVRVRTAVPACIRYGGAEETVTCEDVSRGGVSFRSSKAYVKHAAVQVAVPYVKGAANIFVPGRVAHVRQMGSSYLVGVAYETPSMSRNLADSV